MSKLVTFLLDSRANTLESSIDEKWQQSSIDAFKLVA